MQRCLPAVAIAAGLIMGGTTEASLASGTGTGGGIGHISGFNRSLPHQEPGIDQTYEYGKAMISGRLRKFRNVTFCVANEDRSNSQRISYQSVKHFKNTESAQLYRAIVICRSPEQKILELAEPVEIQALVHYLDDRYNLELTPPTE